MRGMLMATAIAAMASAVSLPATARADEWPEGSAMNVGGLENKRLNAADAMLEKLNKRLLKLVSEAPVASPDIPPDELLVQALRAQDVAWKRYAPEECSLVGALTGSGGTWPTTYAVRCEANLMEMRVRRARGAIRCIERMAPAKRRFDQAECLYQLAPLAVPLRP